MRVVEFLPKADCNLLLQTGQLLVFQNYKLLIGWRFQKEAQAFFPNNLFQLLSHLNAVPANFRVKVVGEKRVKLHAKQAAFGSALGVVLNIALDPLLILALDMGIAGAAVATVLGNGASLLYFIVAIRRKAAAVSISPRDFRPERESLKDMLALGAPSFLGQAAMGVAMLFANSFCMGYSVQTMTASNIAGKAYSVVVMLVMGISMGVQPFLGYNYGKGAKERLRKGLFWGIGMSTGLCLLASAFFLLGGG